ncbi:MAG TPA: ATP-binding protein [Verrucomicrobiae bacterium]|nr:ATP-binding protein [Verrucomicrobiae bacterium]
MVSLENSALFQHLGPDDIAALRQIARERAFAAGQQVFAKGDPGDGLYVVANGLIEISVAVASDNRRVFAKLGPGEFFGEMAVLEFKPRSATATSAENSVVYFIPRDELLAMVERSPALAFNLLREISRRLRDFNQQYISEILQSERLAIIGRFARSIVHDLKNPMHIIGLTAELSGMEKATPESRKNAAKVIRQQVDRVSEMVGDILDFTQGSTSKTLMSAGDYGDFVRRTLEEIRPEAERRGCRIESAEPPDAKVLLDPKRLRRVFYNLIHNATDAMPVEGRVYVRFRLNDSEVITEIEDIGGGIPPEIMGKLFEAFTTFGKAHGTGLGLSICKKIVEDHHGRIWAENPPGAGARFSFALPLIKNSGDANSV